jgi:hypothetical protein
LLCGIGMDYTSRIMLVRDIGLLRLISLAGFAKSTVAIRDRIGDPDHGPAGILLIG